MLNTNERLILNTHSNIHLYLNSCIAALQTKTFTFYSHEIKTTSKKNIIHCSHQIKFDFWFLIISIFQCINKNWGSFFSLTVNLCLPIWNFFYSFLCLFLSLSQNRLMFNLWPSLHLNEQKPHTCLLDSGFVVDK